MKEFPTMMLVVAAAMQDRTGRWLMHRRPEGKPHGGLWEFPGGKVDAGETPVNALIRELLEELDLVAVPEALMPAGFASGSSSDGTRDIVILLYNVRHWSGAAQSLEGGAVGWFTPAEIAVLDKPPLDVELARSLFEKAPG